ncbi:MAG: 2-succinyl-6-hydroxy-2,4-cyclohexadiene-1-carboxylate synthase [Chloroflexi bacterium]|nr:2-succinyl-6-hydroxy-2,4-cyclohexadiene-1-carboxylate synthase [Chloroflexota bacterium]
MLLHGFTGAADVWTIPLAGPATAVSGLAPDLLGHGRTRSSDDPARYTIDRAAGDLIEILDHLHIDRIVLHGYSMGGRLALYTALTFPDRVAALSLESASPGLASPVERAARVASDEELAQRITDNGVESFVDYWEKTPLFRHQAETMPELVRLHQRAIRLSQRAAGLAASLRGMGTGTQPSLWDKLGRLEMPVQLMSGQLDAKFEAIADEMALHIRSCQRVSIARAGHAIHVEAPSSWRAALIEFINSADLRRA